MRDVPRFTDDLEFLVAQIECELLETLTPSQFSLVQHMIEATRMLDEARATLLAATDGRRPRRRATYQFRPETRAG